MLKRALPEPAFSSAPLEVAPARAFYSSRSNSYNESRGLTGGPEVVETLYNS
jgi:hypothetical protein